jgi:hypothetical protein
MSDVKGRVNGGAVPNLNTKGREKEWAIAESCFNHKETQRLSQRTQRTKGTQMTRIKQI